MELTSIGSKLLAPVEKNATLIGAGLAALPLAGSFMDDINRIMTGQVHMPDFNAFIGHLTTAPEYKTAAMAAIGGYFLKQMTNNKVLDQVGNIAQKAAIAYLAVNLTQDLLNVSTHSPGIVGSVAQNFAAAPMAQAYY